jgi:hypothetical protein
MGAMVGTVLHGSRLPVACGVLLTAAALVGGCARVVTGAAQAGDDPQVRPSRPIPVADLLIEPTRFPAEYAAAVVPAKDVDRVMNEIDGVAADSEVSPPECAPLPVLADQKAAVQGTDDERGSRLIVTVIRPVPSVRARVAQLEDCPSFTSTAAGDAGEISKVTVDLPPPPPVDADDSYAVEQTITTQSDNSETTTLTLVALIDDVQVTASWQQGGSSDASPDTESLDTLFTAAVLKVRQEMPR